MVLKKYLTFFFLLWFGIKTLLQNNIENESIIRICFLNIIVLFNVLHKWQKQKVMVMFSSVFSKKKTRMTMQIVGVFSIAVVMGMVTPTMQIEKSFAAAKVPLLPLNSSDSALNSDMAQFYKCIKDTVKGSETAEEPHYFNNEPTKTEMAACYSEVFSENIS